MIREDEEYKYITYIDLNRIERTIKIPKYFIRHSIEVDYKTKKTKETTERIPVEDIQAGLTE